VAPTRRHGSYLRVAIARADGNVVPLGRRSSSQRHRWARPRRI